MTSIYFREINEEKVNQAWIDLIQRKENYEAGLQREDKPSPDEQSDDFDLTIRPGVNFTLKEAIASKDKLQILKSIFQEDKEFIDKLSGAKFTDNIDMQTEHALAWLFAAALNINIEDEEFFQDSAVSGIPFDLWVRLFQEMPAPALETVKIKCKKADYSFDKFKAYLLGVKNVVKFCLDNHSEMICFYETGPTGIMRQRAERMYKKLVPDAKN